MPNCGRADPGRVAMAEPQQIEKEQSIIAALHALEGHWPQGLWLLAKDGKLHVMSLENDRGERFLDRLCRATFNIPTYHP